MDLPLKNMLHFLKNQKMKNFRAIDQCAGTNKLGSNRAPHIYKGYGAYWRHFLFDHTLIFSIP